MKRFSPVFLWRALLIPQFALILFMTWDLGRVIAYQVRNNGLYPRGCFPISLHESIPQFLIAILALFSTIGLCARNPWARIPYAVWCLLITYILIDAVISEWPDIFQAYLIIPLIACFAFVSTLVMSFTPWYRYESKTS